MPHWDWLILTTLLALAWLAPHLGQRFFRPIEAAFSKMAARRSAAVALVFFSTIILRLALLPLLPVPLPGAHDEFCYLLAADTFMHGRLANPPHPMWLSLDTFHVIWFPTYSSIFPPAQGLVLALGSFLGHPWIGVLLSCAAMCAAITWMLQAWMPPRWALLGGVIVILKLGIISYWMNSYWGGAVAAAGGALLLGALPRIFRTHRTRDALLLGLGIAILANSRPLEGLILCLPAAGAFLIWLARSASPTPPVKFGRIFVPLAVLLVLTAAFIGYYNWRLTGNALLMPHVMDRRVHPAQLFLWQPLRPPVHYRNHQFDVFYNTWESNTYFHGTWDDFKRILGDKYSNYTEVFLWPGALLLFLFLPLVFRDRRMRLLLLELAVCGTGLLLVAWSLPHYVAPVACVLYALLVQCLRHLRALRFARRPVGMGLSRLVILLLLFTVGSGLYQRIAHPYAGYWNGNMGNWPRAALADKLQRMPGQHLVIVRYGRIHDIHQEWVFNAADIDASKIVWARELDTPQNQKLLAYFHDRRAWLLQPDDAPGALTPYTPAQATAAAAPQP